jgi:hypothetical protein
MEEGDGDDEDTKAAAWYLLATTAQHLHAAAAAAAPAAAVAAAAAAPTAAGAASAETAAAAAAGGLQQAQTGSSCWAAADEYGRHGLGSDQLLDGVGRAGSAEQDAGSGGAVWRCCEEAVMQQLPRVLGCNVDDGHGGRYKDAFCRSMGGVIGAWQQVRGAECEAEEYGELMRMRQLLLEGWVKCG